MASISTLAVIGAGAQGRDIAYLGAIAGYRTILEDILPNALRRAEDQIRSNLDRAIAANEITVDEAQAAMLRVEYAGSVEDAAREADFVIEAVPDELESKLEIFTLLDKVCRPDTILASNTLTLSVSEIASITYRAPKCVGMRFLHSDHSDSGRSTKLLEIVQAAETDDETLALTVEIAKRMKKEILIIQELSEGESSPPILSNNSQ
ncbi:MAG TPA: 3-hydroxyacyl-CoA dehydrogenase NAD-binding domain-containing protein [Terriglobales bacterium]